MKSYLRRQYSFQNLIKIFLLIIIPLLLIIALMSPGKLQAAGTVILYDARGIPTAFMVPGDSTIYLASGDPAGYLEVSGAVYKFNGQHVGWFSDGILYDNSGYKVAFTDTKKPDVVKIKPVKIDFVAVKKTPPLSVPAPEETGDAPAFVDEISPRTIYDIFEMPAEQ